MSADQVLNTNLPLKCRNWVADTEPNSDTVYNLVLVFDIVTVYSWCCRCSMPLCSMQYVINPGALLMLF